MKNKTYFEKTGKIYGVSGKFYFGKWECIPYVFENYDEALEWLHTEEYDFRERELTSKTDCLLQCGYLPE